MDPDDTPTEQDWKILKRNDAIKKFDELKQGQIVTKSDLINIADYLDEMTSKTFKIIAPNKGYLKEIEMDI